MPGVVQRAHIALAFLVFAHAAEISTAQSVPPPGGQISANCKSPVYATDHLVCSDPRLRALDKELLRLWKRADATNRLDDTERAAQVEWFRTRSQCAFNADHRTCAVASYESRIGVLRTMLGLR